MADDSVREGAVAGTPLAQLEHAIDRVHAEVRGTFNRETVARLMLDSYEAYGESRIQTYVPLFAERLTRERLQVQAQAEGRIAKTMPSILFLCTHNAGRSQMAAGWVKHLAPDRVGVYSGGSEPASEVNPMAIEAMSEAGIDISGEYPKPWTDDIIQGVDIVVTMGCGDACPVFPGVKYVDWEVDDPAGQSLGAVRAIRDDIEGRVRALLDGLDVEVAARG